MDEKCHLCFVEKLDDFFIFQAKKRQEGSLLFRYTAMLTYIKCSAVYSKEKTQVTLMSLHIC